MKNWPFWVGCLLVAGIAAIYYWSSYPLPQEIVVKPPPALLQPVPPPPVKYPIEAVPLADDAVGLIIDPNQPLPELAQSDEQMETILAKLFAEQGLDKFFFLQHIIERCVVMVDNLPRDELPPTHRPFKKVPGRFLSIGKAETLTLDQANSLRYRALIAMLEKVDPQQVTAVYVKLYPLFQEAYEKLGYPEAYFNDRLIEVIDHLLATPTVEYPIRLLQPKALYLYADPALEAESSGRKLLIRTGPKNAARLKNLLQEFRTELVATDLQN